MNQRAYLGELMAIIESVPTARRGAFVASFQDREKNPVVAFGLNVFLGCLGVDRFYLGQVLLGILKLLTVGGFGVWIVVDYFLVAGTAREKSMVMARQLKASML